MRLSRGIGSPGGLMPWASPAWPRERAGRQQLIALTLLYLFPDIGLWLPHVLYK